MKKITELPSNYRHLEQMSTRELLGNINREDQRVALAVQEVLPSIEPLVEVVVAKMKQGGRLFYIGAGTSGRLGILDASECPAHVWSAVRLGDWFDCGRRFGDPEGGGVCGGPVRNRPGRIFRSTTSIRRMS